MRIGLSLSDACKVASLVSSLGSGSLDLLIECGVPAMKVASSEITNFGLLQDAAAVLHWDVILST